ncbi:hypothetical protein J6590_091872, partial [Homalodisca vitripennis]
MGIYTLCQGWEVKVHVLRYILRYVSYVLRPPLPDEEDTFQSSKRCVISFVTITVENFRNPVIQTPLKIPEKQLLHPKPRAFISYFNTFG